MRDFKNLNKIQEIQINRIIDDHKEMQERQKPIYEELERYTVMEVWECGEHQVAKIKTNNNEINYATFHNYKPIRQFAYSFDEAILVCLAYKYDNSNSQFPIYAKRMLNRIS